MDRCVAYLKNNWVNNCLNGAFTIMFIGPPLPKSKVRGTTLDSMQRKEDDWVNPLLAMGRQFWGRKQVNE
jgi:hypothetical protein